MSDLVEFVLDLILQARFLTRPLLFVGIIVIGVGVILLLMWVLGRGAAIMWCGIGSLLVGIVLIAIEIWRGH
jgi:hypothetical protein